MRLVITTKQAEAIQKAWGLSDAFMEAHFIVLDLERLPEGK